MIPTLPDETIRQLEVDHETFRQIIPLLDADAAASVNFEFFSRFQRHSSNAALLRAITTVIHVIRLGSLHLPRFIDLEYIYRAQEHIIQGARDHDVARAWEGVHMLRGLEVPQE